MTLRLFCSMVLCIYTTIAHSQIEICNNNIDDDLDGLIDCFDDDCCMIGVCQDFWYNSCDDDDCLFQGSTHFTMTSTEITPNISVSTVDNFVSGDLDADGSIEVVLLSSGNTIRIIDATNNIEKFSISTNSGVGFAQLAIADIVLNSPGAEIIFYDGLSANAYSSTGTMLWTSSTFNFGSHLSTADFNGDGQVEIYNDNSIYRGSDGTKILSIPGVMSTNGLVGCAMAVDILPESECTFCGGLELISDSQVYAIDIATGNYTLERDYKSQMLGSSLSIVIDWNGDGELDVFSMSNSRAAVWTPFNNTELYNIGINTGSKGLPNIADIDGDGQVEAIFINSLNNGTITALDNDMTTLWEQNVDDNSSFTGMTLFDFDANGTTEIVYRDENDLRILNGSTGNTIQLFECQSATGGEYPIVVDYDNDDQAEILVVCGSTDLATTGVLTGFSSGTGATWADCRTVWNQYNYFNIHVNEDLSIPTNQQNHHIPGNGLRLNNFLNQYQVPMIIEADLAINSLVNVDCETLQIEICNTGSTDIDQSIEYTFYYGDPSTTDIPFGSADLDINLLSNQCETYQINTSILPVGDIFIIINDSGTSTLPIDFNTDFPNTPFSECSYTNNILSVNIGDCNLVEICNNNIDDDMDGFTDCDDSDCTDLVLNNISSPSCRLISLEVCNQGGSTINESLQIIAYNSTSSVISSEHARWTEPISLEPGDCQIINITTPINTVGEYLFNINDNGLAAIPFDIDNDDSIRSIIECDYTNNYTTITLISQDISFNLGDDISLCTDESVIVTGPIGDYQYEWNTGATTQNLNPITSGTYMLNITDNCGNTAEDVINITFGSTDYNVIDLNLCRGDSIIIDNVWVTPISPNIQYPYTNINGCDSIVDYNFNYNEASFGTLAVTKCSNDTYTYIPTGATFTDSGDYDILLANNAGCDSILTLQITDILLDTPIVDVQSTCVDESNGSISISFNNTDVSEYDYNWQNNISYTNEAFLLAANTYQLTITDTNNCSQLLEATVLNPYPPILIDDYTINICSEGRGRINLNPLLDLNSVLLNNAQPQSHLNQAINLGSYSIEYVDTDNCMYSKIIDISLYPETLVSLPDTIYGQQSTDIIVAPIVMNEDPYNYTWTPNGLLSCTDCEITSINTDNNIGLILTVQNQYGCTIELTTYIKVEDDINSIYVPNVFNPNSINNINTVLKPFFKNTPSSVDFKIFDRWGSMIFSTNDVSFSSSWDGSFKGSSLPNGVYIYTLESISSSGTNLKQSGEIILVR